MFFPYYHDESPLLWSPPSGFEHSLRCAMSHRQRQESLFLGNCSQGLGTTLDRTGNTRLLQPKRLVSIRGMLVEQEDHYRIRQSRTRRNPGMSVNRSILEGPPTPPALGPATICNTPTQGTSLWDSSLLLPYCCQSPRQLRRGHFVFAGFAGKLE